MERLKALDFKDYGAYAVSPCSAGNNGAMQDGEAAMKKGILLFLSALLCFGFAALCGPAGGGVCSRVKLSAGAAGYTKRFSSFRSSFRRFANGGIVCRQCRSGREKSKADHKRTGICGNLI